MTVARQRLSGEERTRSDLIISPNFVICREIQMEHQDVADTTSLYGIKAPIIDSFCAERHKISLVFHLPCVVMA